MKHRGSIRVCVRAHEFPLSREFRFLNKTHTFPACSQSPVHAHPLFSPAHTQKKNTFLGLKCLFSPHFSLTQLAKVPRPPFFFSSRVFEYFDERIVRKEKTVVSNDVEPREMNTSRCFRLVCNGGQRLRDGANVSFGVFGTSRALLGDLRKFFSPFFFFSFRSVIFSLLTFNRSKELNRS